jgi:putative alpha-1,2-mannosidase
MLSKVLTCAAACGLTSAAISLPVSNPEEYMYTLGGTRNLGGQENSAGNVMPDVQMPWGFATWSPGRRWVSL